MVEKAQGKIGEPIKACEIIYKAVFQVVFLYSSKTNVAMDAMMKMLEGFHLRIDRQIVGMTARKGNGGEWEWDSVDVVLEVT